MHFRKHTPKRPHINGSGVPQTEDHLRCSVVSTLDVCVKLLIFVTAAAQIDQSKACFLGLFQH